MMSDTRMCRVAYLVDDIDKSVARWSEVLGLSFRAVDVGDYPLKVRLGEHGFEAIETNGFSFAPIEGAFIEVALAVNDAEACRAGMAALGHQPIAVNHISQTSHDEYLFGPDFHGLPVMVAFEGDQEATLAPFETLEDAAAPKLGCCSLVVDDLDGAVADFGRIYDMSFTPTDAAGLGVRAVVGKHRVKLIQRGPSAFADQFCGPLAAFEIMYDDVEAQRRKLEAFGFKALGARALKSGRKAYYFGSQFEGLPIGVYATADDAEIRGL
jgi:catechol 2,3-dioxygenase-like lactoylglutathione lyase family enzyme